MNCFFWCSSRALHWCDGWRRIRWWIGWRIGWRNGWYTGNDQITRRVCFCRMSYLYILGWTEIFPFDDTFRNNWWWDRWFGIVGTFSGGKFQSSWPWTCIVDAVVGVGRRNVVNTNIIGSGDIERRCFCISLSISYSTALTTFDDALTIHGGAYCSYVRCFRWLPSYCDGWRVQSITKTLSASGG